MSTDDENNLPGTPWDILVDQLMRENNATQRVARDLVILDWLHKGDTTPFTVFVFQGHIPSIEIIKYVAWMMNPAKGTDETVPFALVVSSRGRRGRRRDPGIKVRDKLYAQNVELLMREGISYSKALDEVADMVGEGLDNDPRDTVEKAYKRYRSKLSTAEQKGTTVAV